MNEKLYNATFLKACRGEDVDYTPVWLNRQAGRYMPEYHQVKGNTASLDFFKTPHLSATVTCDAQRILGVDAAILFADLLPILEPMGLSLDYLPGVGPQFANPVRTSKDIDQLRLTPASETSAFIGEAIGLIRQELPADIPLIGFGGAPFTLASYAIEGQGSRNYTWMKKMMYGDQGAWDALMSKITDVVIDYLNFQIDSGVQAVQVFDSWVGCLSPADYRQYVLPYSKRLFDGVCGKVSETTGPVPVIHFGTGNPALLADMAEAGGDVLALDWRAPLVETWDRLGVKAVQGNLDPIVLCANREAVVEKTNNLLEEVNGRAGHVFNLGHGIIPETPVDNVKTLVDLVHNFQPKKL